MNPPAFPIRLSQAVTERLEGASNLLRTIQRCEAELDTVFFEKRSFSIPPPPVHFFREESRLNAPEKPRESSKAPAIAADKSVQRRTGKKKAASSNANSDNIGHRIRACREAAGMTQKELAEATGIRRPNIARLEKGRNLPNPSTINRIATALSTTPSSLISENASGHS